MTHLISLKYGHLHAPHFRQKKRFDILHRVNYVVEIARAEMIQALVRNLKIGLFISAAVHVAIVLSYYGIEYLRQVNEDAPVLNVRILKYSDLGPPPSIRNSLVTPFVGVAKNIRSGVGIPVPIPDAEINPEQTIATQSEMSQIQSPIAELQNGILGSERIEITDDAEIINEEPGINEFIPVEKLPQVVRSVQPIYPDIARRAGIEGDVWVKVLIDKKGNPVKAVVIKEDAAGIFNENTIQAALQYQFTPAIMNAGPIKVWVVQKFKYRIVNTE